MDPILTYALFACSVAMLSDGLLIIAFMIKKSKEPSEVDIFLPLLLITVGATVGLWTLLQILPPAFGIH